MGRIEGVMGSVPEKALQHSEEGANRHPEMARAEEVHEAVRNRMSEVFTPEEQAELVELKRSGDLETCGERAILECLGVFGEEEVQRIYAHGLFETVRRGGETPEPKEEVVWAAGNLLCKGKALNATEWAHFFSLVRDSHPNTPEMRDIRSIMNYAFYAVQETREGDELSGFYRRDLSRGLDVVESFIEGLEELDEDEREGSLRALRSLREQHVGDFDVEEWEASMPNVTLEDLVE